jgi:hypothetical protein
MAVPGGSTTAISAGTLTGLAVDSAIAATMHVAGLFGQCASAAGAFAGVTWRNSGTSNVAAKKASMMA